jgi:hypothetical protein
MLAKSFSHLCKTSFSNYQGLFMCVYQKTLVLIACPVVLFAQKEVVKKRSLLLLFHKKTVL